MDDQPLLVFSLEQETPELRALRDALLAEEYPASLGVGAAKDASEEELRSTQWESAFVRWNTPASHDICLIERLTRGEEEADDAIDRHQARVAEHPDFTGRLIVSDHLERTQAVYAVHLLPALMMDEDHPAWDALDVILLCLAQQTEGIIFVEQEGYCDADGELLLAEPEETEEEPPPLRTVQGAKEPEARN